MKSLYKYIYIYIYTKLFGLFAVHIGCLWLLCEVSLEIVILYL